MSRNRRPRRDTSNDQQAEQNIEQSSGPEQQPGEDFDASKKIVDANAETTQQVLGLDLLDTHTQLKKDYRHAYLNLTYIEDFSDQEVPIDLAGVVVTPNNLFENEFSSQEWLSIIDFQSAVQKPYDREVYAAFLQSIDLFDRIPVKLWSVMKAMQGGESDETWKDFLEKKIKDLHSDVFFDLKDDGVDKDKKQKLQEWLDDGCTESGFTSLAKLITTRKLDDYTKQNADNHNTNRRTRAIIRTLPWTEHQLRQLAVLEEKTPDPMWLTQVHSALAKAFEHRQDRESNSLFQLMVQSQLITILGLVFDKDSEIMRAERDLIRQQVSTLFKDLAVKPEQNRIESILFKEPSPDEFFNKKKLTTLFTTLLDNQHHKTYALPSHLEFYANIEAMVAELNKKESFDEFLAIASFDIHHRGKPNHGPEILAFFNMLSLELGKGKDLDHAIMKAIGTIDQKYLDRVPTIRVKNQDGTSSSHEGLYVTKIKKLLSWFYDQRNAREKQLLEGIEYSDIDNGIKSIDLDPEVFSSLDVYIDKIMELVPFFRVETGIGNDEFQAVINHLYKALNELVQTLSEQEIQLYLDQKSSIGSSGKTLTTPKIQEKYSDNKERIMALILEYIKAELLLQGPNDLLFGKGVWPLGEENSTLQVQIGKGELQEIKNFSYLDFVFAVRNYNTAEALFDKVNRAINSAWIKGDYTLEKLEVIKKKCEIHDATVCGVKGEESIKILVFRDWQIPALNLNDISHYLYREAKSEDHINGKSILSHIMHQTVRDEGVLEQYLEYFKGLDANQYHEEGTSEQSLQGPTLQTTPIHEAIIAGNLQGFELLLKKSVENKSGTYLQTRLKKKNNHYTAGESVIELIAKHNDQETAREFMWSLATVLPEQIFYRTYPNGVQVANPIDFISLFNLKNPSTGFTGLQTLALHAHTDLVEELMQQYGLDIRSGGNKKEIMIKVAASSIGGVEVLEWFEKKFLEEEYFGLPMPSTFFIPEGELSPNYGKLGEPYLGVSCGNSDHKNDSKTIYIYGFSSQKVRKKEGESGMRIQPFSLLPHRDFFKKIKWDKHYWRMLTSSEIEGDNCKTLLNNPTCRYSFTLFNNHEYIDAVIMSGDIEKVEYILNKGYYLPELDYYTLLQKAKNNPPESRDLPDWDTHITRLIKPYIEMNDRPIIFKLLTRKFLSKDEDLILGIDYCNRAIKLLREADQQNKKRYEKNLDEDALEKVKEIVTG